MLTDKNPCDVRITSESPICQGTKIFINGEQLKRVTSIALRVDVDGHHEVTIKLMPTSIDASGVFDVTTLEDTSRQFVKGPR